jgi:hypothetical protein
MFFRAAAIVFFLLSQPLNAASDPVVTGKVLWDEASRQLRLCGVDGTPWLMNGFAAIRLSDGTQIRTDQSRFEVTREMSARSIVFRLDDSKEKLNILWSIRLLDNASAVVQLEIFNRSSNPLMLDRVEVLCGKIAAKHEIGKRHVLLNGFVLSPPHPTIREADVGSLNSHETAALESPPVAAGWLTGKRNFGHVDFTHLDTRPLIAAWGECNGCQLPTNAKRISDEFFISTHSAPLAEMERFAMLAARINEAKIWPPRIAWCTWYAGWQRKQMAAYRDGMERGIEQMIPEIQRLFSSRGAKTLRICDDFIDYGDWPDKTETLPGGFRRLADLINSAGLTPGVWYAPYWAEADSQILRDRPDWFARNKGGQTWYETGWQPKSRDATRFAVFDTTHPEVVDYFENTALTWRERGFRYVSTDFLNWSIKPDRYHDPTRTRAEILHAGMAAIRRGLGADIFYRPINNPLGVAMGIANDTRISGDSHGDNPTSFFRAAEVWFYNRRLWLNDPSAIVCARYGKLRDINWNRMWMSWMALAGTVLTYGEVLDELPESYIRMYQRIFPNLPVAGRPLDIWENDPYMLWGMAPGEADGQYELFGVFDVNGKTDQRVRLNLDTISARCHDWTTRPETVPNRYLLWDFWNEQLLTSDGRYLAINRPQKAGRLFALRPDLGRPQLLGTKGHFSCGVVETKDVIWNQQAMTLSGHVRGNGGDPTVVYFHLPERISISEIQLDGRMIASDFRDDSRVLSVSVSATNEFVPLRLTFDGQLPGERQDREFQPGRTTEIIR